MTDTQLDIVDIKMTLKKMQTDIDELARLIAARYDRINCMNLVPSTQACNDVFLTESNKMLLFTT